MLWFLIIFNIGLGCKGIWLLMLICRFGGGGKERENEGSGWGFMWSVILVDCCLVSKKKNNELVSFF